MALNRTFLPIAMALNLNRTFLSTTKRFFSTHFRRQFHPFPPHLPFVSPNPHLHFRHFLLFSTTSSPTSSTTNSTASFDWSDDEDPASASSSSTTAAANKNLPPPYDPFSKKPVVEEPKDPSNLQEVFHKMRTEGLTNYAVKMFDALSRDGLTHEALALFSVIKDKSAMPDVVAHTAVIEAYANAGGHSKEALRTFERMLASGVLPNAYTYAVIVKGLARDGKVADARRLMGEMVEKGMRPNAATYVAVLEAYVREGKEEEARGLVEEMEGKGVVLEEKEVREQLSRRGQMFRTVMGLLFGK